MEWFVLKQPEHRSLSWPMVSAPIPSNDISYMQSSLKCVSRRTDKCMEKAGICLKKVWTPFVNQEWRNACIDRDTCCSVSLGTDLQMFSTHQFQLQLQLMGSNILCFSPWWKASALCCKLICFGIKHEWFWSNISLV